MKNYETIDEYIASFNPAMQERLTQMRQAIRQAAPEATEKIAYGIPTFALQRNIVHFGGYPNHVGFYPGSIGISEFQDKLAGYKTAKGTIQFPNDKPLPLDLIRDITEFCVAYHTAKSKK